MRKMAGPCPSTEPKTAEDRAAQPGVDPSFESGNLHGMVAEAVCRVCLLQLPLSSHQLSSG